MISAIFITAGEANLEFLGSRKVVTRRTHKKKLQ